MKTTFEILLQQVRIERYNARSYTYLSLMARSRQAYVRGLSVIFILLESHTINNAGCHENSDPLGVSKTQTREKLTPLGCIENSDKTLLLVLVG